MDVIELKALELLKIYTGKNDYILYLKYKNENQKSFKITKQQAEYIVQQYNYTPKILKRYVSILTSFAETLKVDKGLDFIPKEIYIEKILGETEKAYHIISKIKDDEQIGFNWIPKTCIISKPKKINYEIDFTKYDHRPPLSHQKTAIETLVPNDRFILADAMGVGKTTSAIIASVELNVEKILIVCPSSLKINWKREIELYTDKKITIIDGKQWVNDSNYYIINFDILKNFYSSDSPDNDIIRKFGFDLMIVDEAHVMSSTTSQRAKILIDIANSIKKVWLLTGTPITSRPINFFNLLSVVKSPIASNWQTYVRRYCGAYQFTVRNRKVWRTDGATNLDELKEATSGSLLRRLKSEVLDLPDKIITPIYLEMNDNDYDEELKKFVTIANENKGKESISVTLNRLMPLRVLISKAKIDYTCELIDKFLELDKKVIVFTNFTDTLDELFDKYRKNAVTLDGRMSKEKRQINVDRFQTDPKVKVFISNLKAGGVGITLTEAEAVIFNDLSFVPAEHSQGEDRAYRYGQKNNVLIYYPIFDNTIEIQMYNIINKKKRIINNIIGDEEETINSFAEELFKDI